MTPESRPIAGIEGQALRRIRVPAHAARLREIRNTVNQALTETGCERGEAADIVLAVDEACQNIIRHGYGGESDDGIVVDIRRDGTKIILYLRDFAEPLNVDKIMPRDLDDVRPGGLGVHFIRQVMDEVDYMPLEDGEGNVLRMAKRIG